MDSVTESKIFVDQYWSSACPRNGSGAFLDQEKCFPHFGFCHGIQINLPTRGYPPLKVNRPGLTSKFQKLRIPLETDGFPWEFRFRIVVGWFRITQFIQKTLWQA